MKDTLFLIKVVLVECLFGTFDVRPVESVGGVASDWSIIPYLRTFTPPEVTNLTPRGLTKGDSYRHRPSTIDF